MVTLFHKSRNEGQAENDSDEESEDDANLYNRKCSAVSLDAQSGMFGNSNILPPRTSALHEGLGHADQWVRDASILALGAIADVGTEEQVGST